MGLFDKLKQSMNIGGVKVGLQAPASARLTDPSFMATVTLTNGEQPATVKSITVYLREDFSREHGQDPSKPLFKDISTVNNEESMSLQPGESRSLQVSVPLNIGAFAGQALPAGTPGVNLANVFGKLEQVTQALDMGHHEYFIEAIADVEGAAIDPAKRVPIQLLRANEVGGGFNVHT